MSEVSLQGISKTFGGALAIDALDLHINDGEFFVLLGPSGCGKTTTLRCIAGLEEPDAGRITIGNDIVVHPEQRVFVPPNKRDIGMVFQSYALWPHMSVYGNVGYPLKMRGRKQRPQEVEEALALVALPVTATAMRQPCPAASNSGWHWRAPLWRNRNCCCSMSRYPISTPNCAIGCATTCGAFIWKRAYRRVCYA